MTFIRLGPLPMHSVDPNAVQRFDRDGHPIVIQVPDPCRRTSRSHVKCKGCDTLLARVLLRARRDGAHNWGWCHACK